MKQTRALLSQVRDVVLKSLPEIQSKRYQIIYKADGSPVTEADKWLECKIHHHLKQHFPELYFIGEESFKINEWQNHSGILAILDPIDGTENFCSGLKEWGCLSGYGMALLI
ncbi:inositol monophosphatase family protein [Azotobacter sp. CWF10]